MVTTVDVIDAAGATRTLNTLPALGTVADAGALPVAQSTEGKAQLGALTEAAPATDTASSGLNGRLQRIAQRLTSLIAFIGTFGAITAGRSVNYDTSGNAIDFTTGTEGSPAGGVSSVQAPGAAMTPFKTFPLPVTPVSGLTAAMTGTTSTAVTGIGAAGVGKFNYITSLVIGNSHATVGTFVELQDGNGGTTFFTGPAAAAYGGAVITFPTPLKQPTSNTALYCKDTTTGANVVVSASGFQA